MTIFRVTKDKNNPYVTLNKSFLEDPEISLKLKGFLAYCLTKPDNWKFHIRQMASVLKEGKDALYSIIDEGIENGYIEREAQKKTGKFKTTNYLIHEVKIKKNNTVSGFPDTENPDTESQTLINNNRVNIEKEITPPTPSRGDFELYGKFVQLTKEELVSLTDQFGRAQVIEVMEEINDYLASTGKKPYKDYAATIRNWMRRRQGRTNKEPTKNHQGTINQPSEAENRTWWNSLAQDLHPYVLQGKIYSGPEYAEFSVRRNLPERAYYKDHKFQEICKNFFQKLEIRV